MVPRATRSRRAAPELRAAPLRCGSPPREGVSSADMADFGTVLGLVGAARADGQIGVQGVYVVDTDGDPLGAQSRHDRWGGGAHVETFRLARTRSQIRYGAPTAAAPVLQSYLDVMLLGCTEYGDAFAEEFLQTTSGWGAEAGAFIDDRAERFSPEMTDAEVRPV